MTEHFEGCIEKNGRFLDLKGPMAVFIDEAWNADLTPSDDAAMIVFYQEPEQVYTIQPLQAHAVLMPSGQPLGAGRQYHLPRGTKICLAGHEDEPASLL